MPKYHLWHVSFFLWHANLERLLPQQIIDRLTFVFHRQDVWALIMSHGEIPLFSSASGIVFLSEATAPVLFTSLTKRAKWDSTRCSQSWADMQMALSLVAQGCMEAHHKLTCAQDIQTRPFRVTSTLYDFYSFWPLLRYCICLSPWDN